jgi:hypothetical protein
MEGGVYYNHMACQQVLQNILERKARKNTYLVILLPNKSSKSLSAYLTKALCC